MAKSKLFKGIVCGLMLTAVVGSTVFAGNYTNGSYGYNVKNVNNSYTGDVGIYNAYFNSTTAGLNVRNNTNSSKYYKLECDSYYAHTNELVDISASAGVCAPYNLLNENITRDYTDARYMYRILGQGYNSTSEITGRADYYMYTLTQYDG